MGVATLFRMPGDSAAFANAIELPPHVLSGFEGEFGVTLEQVMTGARLPMGEIMFLRDGGTRKRPCEIAASGTPEPPPKRPCATLPCESDVLKALPVFVPQNPSANGAALPVSGPPPPTPPSLTASACDDVPAIAFVKDLSDISALAGPYKCGADPFHTRPAQDSAVLPGIPLCYSSGDEFTAGPTITEREQRTPAYRKHVRDLAQERQYWKPVAESTGELSSVRRRSLFTPPDLSGVFSPCGDPQPVHLALEYHSSPVKAKRFYEKQNIGSMRTASWKQKERADREAKARSINDPFSEACLGGTYAVAKTLPSLGFADMSNYRVKPEKTFDAKAFEQAGGFVALVQHDTVNPVVPPRHGPVEMHLWKGRTPSRAFQKVPWTATHGTGSEFALPGACSHPIGVMVTDEGRVAVAPAKVGETETFVVRVNRKTGKVTYCEPIDWRYAAGQSFPRWDPPDKVNKALLDCYENLIYRRLWRDGKYAAARDSELRALRPGPLAERLGDKLLRRLTRDGGYRFNLGPPESRPESELVACALKAHKIGKDWAGSKFASDRPVDPFVAGPVLEQYLSGKSLLIGGGIGAPNCVSVNLSVAFALKSGVRQANTGHLAPKIDHPNGHYPPKKSRRSSIAGTKKDRRTSTDVELNRKAVEAITSTGSSETKTKIAQLLRQRKAKREPGDGSGASKKEIRAQQVSQRWELIARLKEWEAETDPTHGLGQNPLRRWGFDRHASEHAENYYAMLLSFSIEGGDLLQRVKRDTLKDKWKPKPAPQSLKTQVYLRPPFMRWARWMRYRQGTAPPIVYDSRKITVTPDGIVNTPSEPNSASVWAISLAGAYAELVRSVIDGRKQSPDVQDEWFRQHDERVRRFERDYAGLCPDDYFQGLLKNIERGVF